MKIGIPRAMYYYIEPKWLDFFNYLNIPIVLSEKTNNKIIRDGINIANDELCLSMKIFMGHVNNLKGKLLIKKGFFEYEEENIVYTSDDGNDSFDVSRIGICSHSRQIIYAGNIYR